MKRHFPSLQSTVTTFKYKYLVFLIFTLQRDLPAHFATILKKAGKNTLFILGSIVLVSVSVSEAFIFIKDI
jgi:hypothetical protein